MYEQLYKGMKNTCTFICISIAGMNTKVLISRFIYLATVDMITNGNLKFSTVTNFEDFEGSNFLRCALQLTFYVCEYK